MAEAITFEFPVSGSGKKLSGKIWVLIFGITLYKVEDDGTAYRNFLRVVAQRLSQELHSSVESGDRRP